MNAKLRFFKTQKPIVSYIFATVLQLVLLFSAECAYCQTRQHEEVGVFVGVGSYNGEINPGRVLYNPKPAFGFSLRHVFNSRLSVSFQTIWCKISGSDSDFDNAYQQARNASFENEVVDMSLQGEIYFLPLIQGDDRHSFSPYIAAGPGLAVASFPGEGLRFCIPFGAGVKFCPSEMVTLSVEWKFRKLFSDLLDNIGPDYYDMSFGESAAKQRSFKCNDDWYSFLGLQVSFRLGTGRGGKCQAYR